MLDNVPEVRCFGGIKWMFRLRVLFGFNAWGSAGAGLRQAGFGGVDSPLYTGLLIRPSGVLRLRV